MPCARGTGAAAGTLVAVHGFGLISGPLLGALLHQLDSRAPTRWSVCAGAGGVLAEPTDAPRGNEERSTMTAVDLLLVATLLAALLAWWIPALPGRRPAGARLDAGARRRPVRCMGRPLASLRRRLRRFLPAARRLPAPEARARPAVPDRFAVRPAGAAGNRRAVPVPGRAAGAERPPMRSACAISNWTTPADPACAPAGQPRRLLVRAWYPARPIAGAAPRHYFDPGEARSTREASVKYSAFRRCSPTSSTCAPIPIRTPAARDSARLPVVFYIMATAPSPAATGP